MARKIPEFDGVFRNRPNRSGGGVAIYIHQSLNYTHRNDIDYHLEGKIESVFVELCLASKKRLLLGEIHRIPHALPAKSLAHYSDILQSVSRPMRTLFLAQTKIAILHVTS